MANQNQNSESTGCGAGIAKLIAMIGIAFASMGRFADDIFRGCSHTTSAWDDIGRSTSYYDDIGKSTTSFDDIGRSGSSFDDLGNGTSIYDDILRESDLVDDISSGAKYGDESIDDFIRNNTDDIGRNSNPHSGSQYYQSSEEQFFDDFFKKHKHFTVDDQKILLKKAKKVPESSWRTFTQQLEQFGDDMDDLGRAFGDESQITVDYKNAFLESGNIVEARKAILPDELIDLPVNDKRNELFGLLKGMKINDEQAKALSRITKKSFSPTPERYNNYVLIESADESVVTVRTTKSIMQNSSTNIFNGFKVSNSTRVILKGKIDDELVKLCSDKGVRFIRYYDSFLDDINILPSNVKFIYVASKDKNTLKSLFNVSENQVDELLKTVDRIEAQPFSKLVDTEEQLLNAINQSKMAGESPVVVFNNIDNLLFGKHPNSLNISDFITCRSHGIGGVQRGHITSDFIYFDDLVQSAENAKAVTVETGEEFWFEMSVNYNLRLSRRYNQKVAVTVVVGGTVAGGGGFAIYYNTNDKKK